MLPTDTAKVGAVAAWLRAGELYAVQTPCDPFDRVAFLNALEAARALTMIAEPREFLPRLKALFAECGVVVALVPAPKGYPAGGVVRWLTSTKALIQLSLRYKTNDTLWFIFFHECGHIALHGKKMLFLERGKITNTEEMEADRFAVLLSRLSPPACTALWPPANGWELQEFTFRAYCPLCCLEDIRAGRTPYGRRCWLQSWCTACSIHKYPLVAHSPRASADYQTTWSAAELRQDMQFLAANRYRDLKVASESEMRGVMLGSLLEIERALSDALTGIAPNCLVWGNLSAKAFLTVVDDVTTWSLTHFEPVCAWSHAEDLTAVEEQEGYGLVGRLRRQGGSTEQGQSGERSLREVTHPKVHGALRAKCSITAESLPIEYSITGLSDSDATSRMM